MLCSDVVARMVVPAYPFGAEMVKRSGESLILVGREMAGAVVVGRGIGVVGTGVETVVGGWVGTVVGTGEGVGGGWMVWVHPAATSRTAIAQASTTSNEIFIHSDTRGSYYLLRIFWLLRNEHKPITKNQHYYFLKIAERVPFSWIRHVSCAEIIANSTFWRGDRLPD